MTTGWVENSWENLEYFPKTTFSFYKSAKGEAPLFPGTKTRLNYHFDYQMFLHYFFKQKEKYVRCTWYTRIFWKQKTSRFCSELSSTVRVCTWARKTPGGISKTDTHVPWRECLVTQHGVAADPSCTWTCVLISTNKLTMLLHFLL